MMPERKDKTEDSGYHLQAARRLSFPVVFSVVAEGSEMRSFKEEATT